MGYVITIIAILLCVLGIVFWVLMMKEVTNNEGTHHATKQKEP